MCDHCKEDPWYPEIEQFLKIYPDARWGPGHVVLEDFNTDEGCVKWCLELAKNALVVNLGKCTDESVLGDKLIQMYKDIPHEELGATIQFLEYMLNNQPGNHGVFHKLRY